MMRMKGRARGRRTGALGVGMVGAVEGIVRPRNMIEVRATGVASIGAGRIIAAKKCATFAADATLIIPAIVI